MSTLPSPARHASYIQTWITAPCAVPVGSLNFCLHEVWVIFIRSHCWNDRLSIDSRFSVCVFGFGFWVNTILWLTHSYKGWKIREIGLFGCWFFSPSLIHRGFGVSDVSNEDRIAVFVGWGREYPVLVLKLRILEMLQSFLLCHILYICPFFSLHFCRMPFLSTQFCLYSFILVSPPCPLNYNDVTALSEKWG